MNRTTSTARWLGILLALGTIANALAAPPPDASPRPASSQSAPHANKPPPPAWEQLTPAQREMMIAVLRDRWNDNPQERARMLRHAKRWKAMTAEQRQDTRQGMHRWAGMKPEERQRMRAMYEQTREMSPQEREALRAKLKAMSPEQRREWWQKQRKPQPALDATP